MCRFGMDDISLFVSPSVCVILFFSLADTYSDGLGNLDFERSQLGAGMSQRGAAKRLVNALHMHAQKTNQTQFDLQMLRSVASRVNIKVKALTCTEMTAQHRLSSRGLRRVKTPH